jgi:peptidoglycan/xylan/chitin deacetylase (PgdA/CDA1 family)
MLARGVAIAGRYGLTATKMDAALAQLAAVLREFGCQATLPVTATTLSRNQALVKMVQAQGLELAMHGYAHVDYTQLSLEQQREHLRRARQIFEQAGVKFTGFRCPYLRWNADTIRVLGECSCEYDSSQALAWDVAGEAETDSYRRALDFYGAQMAGDYPALPYLSGSLVRIPYCLPDDEALIERLKLAGGAGIAEIWLAMLDRIYTAGELFTLGLHPERVPLLKDALRAVLAKARSLSPLVWIARLDEIAAWYRGLGLAGFETQPHIGGGMRVSVHAPAEATLLVRCVDVQAPTKAWAQGYEQILSSEFVLRGELHPWIGLAPDSAGSLQSFLRHLGYLVEISANPQAFSYYIEQNTFQAEDERKLLAELETGNRPLLRLGRWPGGAQAALAVTGDVDAITLWDYGLRLWNN